MIAFKHTHAKSVRVEYQPDARGGIKPSNLIVVASIPLQPSTTGYNVAQVNTLAKAATAYATTKGIPTVTFESTE